MKPTWRLLLHPPAEGAWNMAVDDAILEFCGKQSAPPTLRLYAWDPPCLSLGYAQPVDDIDQAKIRENGWQWVRRPTGGRAILHTDELTYAVIAPQSDPVVAGSVLESYQRISTALLGALRALSLPAQAKETERGMENPSRNGPVCFEVPSHFEITVDGKKLIGSAQARRQNGVLQHGTIPLTGDLTRILSGLKASASTDPSADQARLLERATTLQLALGKPVSWNEMAQALRQSFEQTFGLVLLEQPLSQAEQDRAHQVYQEKYTHPGWNARI